MENTTDKDRLKDWARHLFTVSNRTLPQVADDTGISECDLRLWSGKENWETLRKNLLTSKEHHIGIMYQLLDKVNQKMLDAGEPNPKDAELMVRYTAAIKNLDTGIDIGHITEVARSFCTWMRPRDREMAIKIALLFNDYITHCMKDAQ